MVPTIKEDQAVAERMAGLKCDAVVYDDQGRALGYFSPIRTPTRLDELQLESPRSIEEIEETRKRYAGMRPEEVGKPLKEILSRWGL